METHNSRSRFRFLLKFTNSFRLLRLTVQGGKIRVKRRRIKKSRDRLRELIMDKEVIIKTQKTILKSMVDTLLK
jgi:hypothetical protein